MRSGAAPPSAAASLPLPQGHGVGTAVTVTPTDSLGHTFDVQTYNFARRHPTPSSTAHPPAGTTSTSASFSFHATLDRRAAFTCRLDGGTAVSCTSPVTYSGLTQGPHTFSVYATVGERDDPAPATCDVDGRHHRRRRLHPA